MQKLSWGCEIEKWKGPQVFVHQGGVHPSVTGLHRGLQATYCKEMREFNNLTLEFQDCDHSSGLDRNKLGIGNIVIEVLYPTASKCCSI